jgi:flagellar biosynthesis chaperone FliJ
MVKYSRITQEKRPSSLSTKRQRRAAIEKIMQNLEQIKESEERYRERIPENLQSSTASEAAEQWIDTLEEVIGLLGGLP